MDKYDYYIEVQNDVENWIESNNDLFNISNFDSKDDAAEYLYDKMWDDDSITGNGPGGYADEYLCEEFLCHNLDLLIEAMREFDVMHDPFSIRSYIDNHRVARYLDCTIRCYVLGQVIDRVLEKYKGE